MSIHAEAYWDDRIMEETVDEEGFCVVSRKKGRKRRGLSSSANKGDHCNLSVLPLTSDIEAPPLIVKIKQCVNDLQISRFFSEFKETWRIAQHRISNRLPQNDISAEHCISESLIKDTTTEGRGHSSQSNVHSTQESNTKVSLKQTDPKEEDDKIFARSEDEEGRRRQASARMPNSSLHPVTDSTMAKAKMTQSDKRLEDTAHEQGENLNSAGVEKLGFLENDLAEMTESRIVKDRGVKQIVCYGLGNFSSCVTARFQLALLILLNSLVSPNSCYLYDPHFSDVEKQVLEQLGYSILNKNEEGKRRSTEPTLFFMPHCGKPLYNNLLWANWGQRLSNLFILGNSFNNFSERFTARQLKEEVPYIQKVIQYHHEVSVKNSFQFTDIFNDMAFQVFPVDLLQTAPSTLWTDKPEPSYDHMNSVEIITSSSTS